MTYLEKVRNLCDSRGISINKLENDLGFSNGSIVKGMPNAQRLYKISDYFNVPMEYFLGDEDDVESYYERIYNDIKKFSHHYEQAYIHRVAAGEGAYNDVYSDEVITDAESGYEYAEVIGDSMLPEIRNGDIVKVQPQEFASPTDYALVKVDGEHATVKFIEVVDNGVWLRALNKEVYEDHFFTVQEVMTLPIRIIGKVVQIQRNV